jgi:hypothetical protein
MQNQPWELDFDDMRVNAGNWYRSDANKETIYYWTLALWSVWLYGKISVM